VAVKVICSGAYELISYWYSLIIISCLFVIEGLQEVNKTQRGAGKVASVNGGRKSYCVPQQAGGN